MASRRSRAPSAWPPCSCSCRSPSATATPRCAAWERCARSSASTRWCSRCATAPGSNRRRWLQIAGLGYSLAYIDLPAAHDHPPPWHEPTGPIGYLRLHGRNSATWFAERAGRDARYDYLYCRAELGELGARAQRIARVHDETFVITNNHFEGKAVANALEILSELRGGIVDGPAELVRTYPRLAPVVRVVADPSRAGQGELF